MSATYPDDALCAQVGPDPFFPPEDSHSGAKWALAKAICAQCHVADECLADAMDAEAGLSKYSRFGVYGGLSPAERAAADRARVAA